MEIIVVKNYTHLFEANRIETEHDRLVFRRTKRLIGPPFNEKDNAAMPKAKFVDVLFFFFAVVSIFTGCTYGTAFIYSATSWAPSLST